MTFCCLTEGCGQLWASWQPGQLSSVWPQRRVEVKEGWQRPRGPAQPSSWDSGQQTQSYVPSSLQFRSLKFSLLLYVTRSLFHFYEDILSSKSLYKNGRNVLDIKYCINSMNGLGRNTKTFHVPILLCTRECGKQVVLMAIPPPYC